MGKTNLVLLFVLNLVTISVVGKTVAPVVSVYCSATEESVSEFNFDLYATGHPMGGVTMFTGMFEVKSEELFECQQGFIKTMPPKNGKLFFTASVQCARDSEIELLVDTNQFHKGIMHPAVLSYRDISPIGFEAWTQQNMTCVEK